MRKALPDYGQRPLPSLIDEIAERDPERPYVSISQTSSAQDGYKDISFSSFAKAVNRCSWWMEEQLGRGHGFETLAYMGPQDLMYPVLIMASIKTGYKVSMAASRRSEL